MHAFAERHARPDPSTDRGVFVFLDRRTYELSPSLTVVGCTLWSKIADSAVDRLLRWLNEFRPIRDFDLAAYNAAHRRDLAWLNGTVQQLSSSQVDKKIVVLTHHAPLREGSSDPQFKDSPSNSAFSTDLFETTVLDFTERRLLGVRAHALLLRLSERRPARLRQPEGLLGRRGWLRRWKDGPGARSGEAGSSQESSRFNV